MPSGEPVYPPPPQLLLYPMRRLMTYKGEVCGVTDMRGWAYERPLR